MALSLGPGAKRGAVLDTPEWFRQEAEKCFSLAEKLMDEGAADALVAYGAELIARAERMDATLAAAVSMGPVGAAGAPLPNGHERPSQSELGSR